MSARPPTTRTDEPESIEFGIAAVDARLTARELSFPATSEEIKRELGTSSIPYDPHGNTVSLETALSETGRDRFESERELLNELHPVFEQYRSRRRSRLLSRIRSILPV